MCSFGGLGLGGVTPMSPPSSRQGSGPESSGSSSIRALLSTLGSLGLSAGGPAVRCHRDLCPEATWVACSLSARHTESLGLLFSLLMMPSPHMFSVSRSNSGQAQEAAGWAWARHQGEHGDPRQCGQNTGQATCRARWSRTSHTVG